MIAIDSFRHMYMFPKFEDMYQPGKLKQFLQDLYSGKLHRLVLKHFCAILKFIYYYFNFVYREFHYGPDPSGNEVQTEVVMKIGKGTSPPESSFKKLGPSKNRYTLLHKDEL